MTTTSGKSNITKHHEIQGYDHSEYNTADFEAGNPHCVCNKTAPDTLTIMYTLEIISCYACNCWVHLKYCIPLNVETAFCVQSQGWNLTFVYLENARGNDFL